MPDYIKVGNLQIAQSLYEFINTDVMPGINVDQKEFWSGFDMLVKEFMPENEDLLATRERMQKEINQWHRENREGEKEKYEEFLIEIGYLESEGKDNHVEITTENVDDEIAMQAGPQLVVPVDNARFALNAVNSRWGSLYDALYGTDAINESGPLQRTKDYNAKRGEKVIEHGKDFLEQAIPLKSFSHREATAYYFDNDELKILLANGKTTGLKDVSKVIGYQGEKSQPQTILFQNNKLHFELQIDRNHPVGLTDQAGVKDILIESALTTIMDCEDSVAAVDAEDKVAVYRNWLGLMKGDLTTSFLKGDTLVSRKMNEDRVYNSLKGNQFSLKGRSLMLVRNVGHLMKSDAILTKDGEEVYEGIIDAVVTSLAAMHSLKKDNVYKNSIRGSIYIVKPKMHGSEEVAFANKLFNRTEDLLGLDRYTLKIGVMDEERRTSLNLKSCIREVENRIFFINTGFLDRTGDEIHTSMEAGVMLRKNSMKSSEWLKAYEESNVIVGLASGLQGRGQIGKGMWAKPDRMAEMIEQKIEHLQTGATTAWVPSPTAATLHALHYHQLNVKGIQDRIKFDAKELKNKMLTLPLSEENWTPQEIQEELENNIQGILGYVVRWIDQGIGCSKVPDINNIGLMEDRATLRISSQHITNWLYHELCTEEQVVETMKKMAKIVDDQNTNDLNYKKMADNYEDSIAFQAASSLIFKGLEQPNGYTEPILHHYRKMAKAETIVANKS